MPWANRPSAHPPDVMEKLISAANYLTSGLVGLLYIIFGGKHKDNQFFRFHWIQSIILGILGIILSWTFSAFGNIFGGMLGMVGAGSGQLMLGVGMIMQLFMTLGFLLCAYGVIFSLLGKYAEIPFISKIVRSNLR